MPKKVTTQATSSKGILVLIPNEHANATGRRHACCICSSEHCRHFLSDDWKHPGFHILRHFNGDDAKLSQANDVAWGPQEARDNTVYARDELEALFDVGSGADMEDGKEDEEASSSRRDDPSVGSRRHREDDSDASSPKRSRSDRPLADAGPLSSPRSEGDPTSSGTVVSRTGPVRDLWMLSPSQIQSHFGSTAPPSHRVPEWQALCQSWGAFVENFNKDPASYRERVRLARERYERFSKRPKVERLHRGAVEAGIPCPVPMGITCEHCHVGAVRVSERDINGYIDGRAPEELKTLRTNLIARMTSSATGGSNTLSRAVGDYSSRSSFTPFGGFGGGGLRTSSPFPERPASGRSAAPTYRGSEEILSNEYENDPDPGSGSDDQQFAGRSSELPPVRLAVGVEAAGRRRGSRPPDSVDCLEAVQQPPDG
ncbi:unnamed protein product [Phytophthora fragariaefolia]|uniref:Unnamed protein product n=1 Tax=Phytophthora fragariaefolia TaxID=1490495 RepID=A0A9W7D144_9STRA|nr:unnamed protein product [Phytophthora fragariaefolia]